MQKLVVTEDDFINAYAIGVPGFNLIGVTKGAVEQLDPEELEALFAHEMAHIKHWCTLISLGSVVYFAYETHRIGEAEDKEFARKLIKLAITRFVFFNAMTYAFEILADRSAKKKGYGLALASALSRVKVNRKDIIHALMKGNYHPSTKSRVRRLTK